MFNTGLEEGLDAFKQDFPLDNFRRGLQAVSVITLLACSDSRVLEIWWVLCLTGFSL